MNERTTCKAILMPEKCYKFEAILWHFSALYVVTRIVCFFQAKVNLIKFITGSIRYGLKSWGLFH